jgi:hypothetical protein
MLFTEKGGGSIIRQMSVYILKDNQQIGPLQDAEVIAGLQSGTFSPEDHGWRDGMTHRVPLYSLFPPSQAWAMSAPLPQRMSPPPNLGDNAGMRLLLPVGQSGWAVAAGYLGLFSVLLLPAPLALILSIVALLDIQKSKSTGLRKHGTGRAIFGLVMGVLGTGLLLWITVLSRH